MTKQNRFDIAITCFLAILSSTQAKAAIFRIDYNVTLDDFTGGTVLGVSSPTDLNVSYYIDTEAAPIILKPANAGTEPFNTDLYGFDISAISNLSVVSFGTNTWDITDISLTSVGDNFLAYVWFNAPLADGATPETIMALDDGNGLIIFGGGQCGVTCTLVDVGRVIDLFQGSDVFGSPMNVNVSLIPVPPALWLFGSGLLGLIGVARKKA